MTQFLINPAAENKIRFPLYFFNQPEEFAPVTILQTDVKIYSSSLNGATPTNTPASHGSFGVYTLTLTAAECDSTEPIIVTVQDTGTKVYMDAAFTLIPREYGFTKWASMISEWVIVSGPTTTGFTALHTAGSPASAVADSYEGRSVIFTTGASSETTAYIQASTAGSPKSFTVSEMSSAPVAGARFLVMP